MSIDNKLDTLRKIRTVEVPPFLFTRIKEQLSRLADAPAPVKWKLAFAGTALLILVLNAGILFRSGQQPKKQGLQQVVNSLQLSTSNDFYHE